jgi:hypothetical protein
MIEQACPHGKHVDPLRAAPRGVAPQVFMVLRTTIDESLAKGTPRRSLGQRT